MTAAAHIRPTRSLPVLRTELDQLVARAMTQAILAGTSIACRRGCAACCYEAVDVTEVEAAAILDHVRDDQGELGVTALLERCRDQLDQAGAAADDGDAWLSKRLRCVFLDRRDNCSVYGERPHPCRALLVVGTAEQCGRLGTTYAAVNTVSLRLIGTFADVAGMAAKFGWTGSMRPGHGGTWRLYCDKVPSGVPAAKGAPKRARRAAS